MHKDQKTIAEITKLDQLLEALEPISAGDIDSFSRILSSTKLPRSEVEKYSFFEKEAYTRNLVKRCEHYELLVLCWEVNQVSPIHNHESQDCWMYVVDGIIEEAIFQVSPQEDNKIKVELDKKSRAEPGGFVFINDEVGLHQVSNVGENPAISLHLYSLPFDRCNIYCEETGLVTSKVLQYYSVDGKKVETPSSTS